MKSLSQNTINENHGSGTKHGTRSLHREIGIRAGEKLHELMISEDDARNSFEFADRYAILTPFLNPEKSIYERRGGELKEVVLVMLARPMLNG